MVWYRGDIHVHSLRSVAGEMTVDELVAAARLAGLDFIAVTEHNALAEGLPAGVEPLVIAGREVVTPDGHWLEVGDGLRVVAHPCAPYPSGTFRGSYDGFGAVEVWNGRWASDLPWQADNEAALAGWGRGLADGVRRGRWLPAVGNSDAHLHGQLGTPHNVVRAARTDAVLAGVRAGRSWIAESAAVRLSLTAGGAGIGERVDSGGKPVAVRLSVAGVPSGVVTLHTEDGPVCREVLPAGGEATVSRQCAAEFVRAEIRHPDGRMAALTNPVVLCSGLPAG